MQTCHCECNLTVVVVKTYNGLLLFLETKSRLNVWSACQVKKTVYCTVYCVFMSLYMEGCLFYVLLFLSICAFSQGNKSGISTGLISLKRKCLKNWGNDWRKWQCLPWVRSRPCMCVTTPSVSGVADSWWRQQCCQWLVLVSFMQWASC